MTTTGTRGSPAGPAILSLVLLATLLLLAAAGPMAADDGGQSTSKDSRPMLMPEPMTLVFVGVAGLALFRRTGRARLH
jgi:hypothetical protein